ncbi:MAG TPA: ATP-dependent Clp protease ATP-binding subunit, partial [Tepidisphaeraceae bacterium]|nr:ATP-dependent Clp protease ATP-binding subunit [Tepidisphaeraceae bacterium]
VLDEAGARIRLRSMTKPPNLADLEEQIERLSIQKDEAVKNAEYEEAARLRDQAEALRKKKEEMQRQWREKSKEIDGVVDEEVIAEVVSKMTGVPLTRLEKEEAQRLLELENELHKRVVSQDEAIKAIAKTIRRARSGLKDPNRPMGSFLFLGPSGVGKTLLSKALAEFMFGDEDALVKIDMSEYMEKHNVSRLIGAPPGYVGYEEGGQLTERIRRRPYSVVLLDEVEKAHPDVFNMLLQIMEEGRLTDSFGRHVDFRNVVMIMTSNIGSELIKGGGNVFGLHSKAKGASEERTYQSIKETVMKEVERYFRPEFIGRLDDVIVFRPLSRENLENVVEMELKKVTKRLRDHGLHIEMTKEAKDFLIDKGTNADFGARPLRRALEQNVEDPLSEEILRGNFKGKNLIKISVKTEEDNSKHLFFDACNTEETKSDKQLTPAATSDAT